MARPGSRAASPAGARLPGDAVEACVYRELREEAVLALEPEPAPWGRVEWALFAAEPTPGGGVRLDPEHDAHDWVALEEALARCRPQVVADGLACVAASLARYDAGQPGQL